MRTILFIKIANSSFILQDEEFLKRNYPTKVFFYKPGNFSCTCLSQLKMIFWLLINIFTSRIIFTWFADYHSLIPVLYAKLFGKKSIIVVGGYEAAKIERLNYGIHLRPFRSFCARRSFDLATLLLPVSNFTSNEIRKYSKKNNHKVVCNGVDAEFFKMQNNKENTVLTVCGADDIRTVRTKGVDVFVEVAKRLPEIKFVVVGLTGVAHNYIRKNIDSTNIHIVGRVSQAELLDFYRKAKIYCQLSVYESFCMTLAEAMLCECIPVVTNSGALPEVVGKVGIIARSRNIDKIADIIRKAITMNSTEGQLARIRILENFTIEKRYTILNEIIQSFLK